MACVQKMDQTNDGSWKYKHDDCAYFDDELNCWGVLLNHKPIVKNERWVMFEIDRIKVVSFAKSFEELNITNSPKTNKKKLMDTYKRIPELIQNMDRVDISASCWSLNNS